MRRIIGLIFIVFLIAPASIDVGTAAQDSVDVDPSTSGSLSAKGIEESLEGPVDVETIVATSSWVHSTGVVDWLGPLAPVALSPFFGVTCLSGLSLWGPDWATNNVVLDAHGPLRSELLFCVFLTLTILTSLPRLTKVSKPFAQAVDRLETYAVIVILLVIKVGVSMQSPAEGQVAMVQLGIVSMTVDTLLGIAMVINILVINSVKFFFEFMVWLTPVPLLDAIFEICNKSLCALLMAIYAFSPTLATLINLSILLLAAIVLRWISRRVRFYRCMVLDPLVARVWRGYATPTRPELTVFPTEDVGPFKAKSRLRLRPAVSAPGDTEKGLDETATSTQDTEKAADGWLIEEANWWMPSKEHLISRGAQPEVRCGWVTNSVCIEDGNGQQTNFIFSRRYSADTLESLAKRLGMKISDESIPDGALKATLKNTLDRFAGEFA